MVERRAHAVSAPGKVLLAGGYLVLDPAYTGLVFGLDARIHVLVQDLPSSKGVSLSEIVVRSPQFDEPAWEYSYRTTGNNGGIEVTQLSIAADQPLNPNPFVETTLRYALSYIAQAAHPHTLAPASITILADNDYYTTPASLAKDKRFHRFNVPLSQANKTGLGSSAALVTSLTAALLRHYLPADQFSLASESGKQKLHNLAQAAHCAAQGKVGSGFDVASAVFGSCLYRRFSPDILSSLPEPGTPGFATALQKTVDGQDVQWDHQILKDEISMPKDLRIVMCDVSCGSQTPGMVKKVLAWRKKNPAEADRIWSDLQSANLSLANALKTATNTSSKDSQQLSSAFNRIRDQIRAMGDASCVPIEPPAQTELIDACCELPGVVGGTVPGAGGYDAVVLLVKDEEEVYTALDRLLAGWRFDGTDGQPGRVRMLGVKEEMDGVKEADVSYYSEWVTDT